MDIPHDYPLLIKRVRAKLGLTQARLAELMGVSFATVNRWENRQSRPSSLAWRQITRAEQLGVDALGKGHIEPRGVALPPESEQKREVELDFSADPEAVRVIVEGHRLSFGHQHNPTFATEISLIEPLPHQRIAVYERMLPQPRLRFLLADDPGAGKTIMAGLYIREMLARRLIRRVLVVPPAGLVGNWLREMRTLFTLPFRIVTGADAREENPFLGSDGNLIVVSVDTLAGGRMFAKLQEEAVSPYDLVIMDEAHKLSADREPDFRTRKTDRYLLAEALAGVRGGDPRWHLDWGCQHLLLLTATPHMGKDFPYYCIWRLLEPQVFTTIDAFNACPAEARSHHFIRRAKEEMVRLDGTPIYPTRHSDTLSYNLHQGAISEQALYDQTTRYIETYYNRARILNRSAARFAMTVFQRRLASSTYALMLSFERRLAKLDALITDIQSGRLSPRQLLAMQRKLDTIHDPLDDLTADEEQASDDREENEVTAEQAMGGVVAVSLAELQAERMQVDGLLTLAKQVYERGEESKFQKLAEVIRDPDYKDEKLIIFTEHRDTLSFLVRKLEGIGFTGQVAQIHGGMDAQPRGGMVLSERDQQVEFFRRPVADEGANYLVATDAAGEGINLQFAWLMVNYDIPWNPARLEQRMGRIHRYGQQHDPVVIINLVAGKTREGRVLRTLLVKLERIRKELGSDKVFDVVGRLFEGVSIRAYMEQAVTDQGADQVVEKIEGTLTKEQVEALREREKRLFGEGGDVRKELPRVREITERETYRRLLPGYVRHFVEKAIPLLDLTIDGSLDETFSLHPVKPGALDSLLQSLEEYTFQQRKHLTFYRPSKPAECIWLHPGEPFFHALREHVCSRFAADALRGGVFIDPTCQQPYFFHLALVSVVRKADDSIRAFDQEEPLEYRLIGIKQDEAGTIDTCPVENLLLLKGSNGIPPSAIRFASAALQARTTAMNYLTDGLSRQMADEQRRKLLEQLPSRLDFVTKGYDYQDAELAAARTRLSDKARNGDARAKAELTRIKERQRALAKQQEEALTILRTEPELVSPGEVKFLAHAVVVPTADPEDKKRHDAEIEAIAVKVAWAYEESLSGKVKDVSTPQRALAAGLNERPGFDLLSIRSGNQQFAIEVKGRAGVGDIEVTDNEWAKACNLRDGYWLYVVFTCASSHPQLMRVQDPFGRLLAKSKGGVIIGEQQILQAAEANQ